jgi:hypothetical protein
VKDQFRVSSFAIREMRNQNRFGLRLMRPYR